MVIGVIGFDCNCVGVWWSQMYQVSSEIFNQMEMELIWKLGEGEGFKHILFHQTWTRLFSFHIPSGMV